MRDGKCEEENGWISQDRRGLGPNRAESGLGENRASTNHHMQRIIMPGELLSVSFVRSSSPAPPSPVIVVSSSVNSPRAA